MTAGWGEVTIGDVCTKPQYGWTTKARTDGGEVRLLRTTDITSGQIDWSSVPFCTEAPPDLEKYLIRENDIVISRAGSVGVSYLITKVEPAVFASYLIRFRPGPQVLPEYLAYFLKSPAYWKQIADNTSGIAIPNVNASKLQEVRLHLVPLDQQRLIVAEIEKQFSRLDKAVAGLQRVKANLKRYKAAILKAAVEGRLVPTEADLARREGRSYETGTQLLQRILEIRRSQWQGKGKYKEPAAPDTTDLPELPEGWTWATLPQLGELGRGKSKHRPRDDDRLYGGPYPFIQTGDVRRSDGSICEHTQTYSELGLAQSRLWPAGTLCITIAANIAETGILTFESCFPDSVVGFISATEPVTTRYAEFFVRTAKNNLDRFASATAQKNINLEVLDAVGVALPPLPEQHRIVAEVDRLLSITRETEAEVDTNLKRAQSLRYAILSAAFSNRKAIT